jgi:hypothetical protein
MYITHSVRHDATAAMQTKKTQTFLYNYNNILIYIHTYMFWASLAHNPGDNVCRRVVVARRCRWKM